MSSLVHDKIDDYGSNEEVPFEHLDQLGQGNSGWVEKVQHKTTKQVYARKSMAVTKKTREEQEAVFLNEIAVIRRLCSHHHFIKVVAAYRTSQRFGIILHPVAEDGNLSEYLDRFWDCRNDLEKLEAAESKFNDAEREFKAMTLILQRTFGCLTGGLAFMHKQRIRHKDIKPQNVLVHSGDLLFTDFGYSLDSSRFSNSATEGRPSFLTRRYCAKEVLEHERRNSSSDVWSLGCVLIEVLSALSGAIEICEDRLFSEAMPDIHTNMASASISDEYIALVDILVRMTSLEACMRPTSKEVKELLSLYRTFNCEKCHRQRNPNAVEKIIVDYGHKLQHQRITQPAMIDDDLTPVSDVPSSAIGDVNTTQPVIGDAEEPIHETFQQIASRQVEVSRLIDETLINYIQSWATARHHSNPADHVSDGPFSYSPTAKERLRDWLLAQLKEHWLHRVIYRNILIQKGLTIPAYGTWEERASSFWDIDHASDCDTEINGIHDDGDWNTVTRVTSQEDSFLEALEASTILESPAGEEMGQQHEESYYDFESEIGYPFS